MSARTRRGAHSNDSGYLRRTLLEGLPFGNRPQSAQRTGKGFTFDCMPPRSPPFPLHSLLPHLLHRSRWRWITNRRPSGHRGRFRHQEGTPMRTRIAATVASMVGALAVASVTFSTPTATARKVNWDAVAQCESGGDWSINTGNGYYGGLQFLPRHVDRKRRGRVPRPWPLAPSRSGWPRTCCRHRAFVPGRCVASSRTPRRMHRPCLPARAASAGCQEACWGSWACSGCVWPSRVALTNSARVVTGALGLP